MQSKKYGIIGMNLKDDDYLQSFRQPKEVFFLRFIDVNCMIGEWGFGNLYFKTAEQLIDKMDMLGIDKALVFDSKSWLCDIETGNKAIVQSVKHYDRLLPVITLTPLIEQEFGSKGKLLDFMKKNNIKAVRLFPFDQNYTLYLWNVKKLFQMLNEIKIPVLIECREMRGTINPWFNQIYEIAKEFPNVPIILLTIGYRSLRILYELFEECMNIFIDTSTFITYHGLEEVVKLYGSERILFGTRMPFIEGGVSVGRIIYADISQEDKDNIAQRNIIRLMENCTLNNITTEGEV